MRNRSYRKTVEDSLKYSNEHDRWTGLPNRGSLENLLSADLTNGICGFEALARIRSAAYGLIPPLEFIPIAAKTKLILPIGQKIIQQALGFLKKRNDKGYGAVGVSINISAIQLMREDFAGNLFEMIDGIGVAAQNIILEVTESVFSSNYQE